MASCKACELEGRMGAPAHRMTAPPTCERHYEQYMAGTHTLRGEAVQKTKPWTPPAPDDEAPAPPRRAHLDAALERAKDFLTEGKSKKSPTLQDTIEQREKKERQGTMPKTTNSEVRTKAVAEYVAGVPAPEVAKKYGVSTASVYLWAKAQEKRGGSAKPAARRTPAASAKPAQAITLRPQAPAGGNGAYQSVLDDLIAKRDKLTHVIEALKGLMTYAAS